MELLDVNLIQTNLKIESKTGILQKLAELAVANDIATDEEAVYESLLEREALVSTGMMDGFAIPHAHAITISKPAIIILKNSFSIEWESLDDKPIIFIIGLFVPKKEQSNEHLKLISDLSKLLMKSDIRKKLLLSDNPLEIKEILNF